MSDTLNITIHDVTTGEIITRPMSRDELDRETIAVKNYEQAKKEQQERAVSKAALLDRLGITEDEARLLLS